MKGEDGFCSAGDQLPFAAVVSAAAPASSPLALGTVSGPADPRPESGVRDDQLRPSSERSLKQPDDGQWPSSDLGEGKVNVCR